MRWVGLQPPPRRLCKPTELATCRLKSTQDIRRKHETSYSISQARVPIQFLLVGKLSESTAYYGLRPLTSRSRPRALRWKDILSRLVCCCGSRNFWLELCRTLFWALVLQTKFICWWTWLYPNHSGIASLGRPCLSDHSLYLATATWLNVHDDGAGFMSGVYDILSIRNPAIKDAPYLMLAYFAAVHRGCQQHD